MSNRKSTTVSNLRNNTVTRLRLTSITPEEALEKECEYKLPLRAKKFLNLYLLSRYVHAGRLKCLIIHPNGYEIAKEISEYARKIDTQVSLSLEVLWEIPDNIPAESLVITF